MKTVLDVCCGSKMFYFDKNGPRVTFCDNRTLSDTLCDGRTPEVKPDILADFTALPFADDSYPVVVFDPPRLTTIGTTSYMAKKYGKLPPYWQTQLRNGFAERFRVAYYNHRAFLPI